VTDEINSTALVLHFFVRLRLVIGPKGLRGGKGDSMGYRKLLQPVTTNAYGPAALDLAFMLARDFEAQLNAVVVRMDSRDIAPLAGEGLSAAMIEDMIAVTEREAVERSRAAQGLFERLLAGYGLPLAPNDGACATLQIVSGQEELLIPGMARLSDLTILPHPCAEEEAGASECLHAVLFESGRPVLIAPKTAPAAIGERCCVAWNGTVEASSALAAMLPWLKRAKAVRILHAGDYQRNGPGAEEVLPYLRLHGVDADLAGFTPINRDVGAGMLLAAQEFGADLLGMGAYSHSRLRQLILGGVTRHVLGHAKITVLMAR